MSAPTAPPTSVHDIKALVQSFHPLIVIETVEEERARALVLDAGALTAADLRVVLAHEADPIRASGRLQNVR